MRKLMFLLGIIVLSGCLTMRSYTNQKPRKDLGIEGNQGCLSGECKQEARENKLGDTRTVSVIEVEFGPREVKGDEVSKNLAIEEMAKQDLKENVSFEDMDISAEESEEVLEEAAKPKIQYYVVTDNDTLQKISHKFYGTTRKWNFIYETNKDVLKSPDRLYPGTKIKIVPLDK